MKLRFPLREVRAEGGIIIWSSRKGDFVPRRDKRARHCGVGESDYLTQWRRWELAYTSAAEVG